MTHFSRREPLTAQEQRLCSLRSASSINSATCPGSVNLIQPTKTSGKAATIEMSHWSISAAAAVRPLRAGATFNIRHRWSLGRDGRGIGAGPGHQHVDAGLRPAFDELDRGAAEPGAAVHALEVGRLHRRSDGAPSRWRGRRCRRRWRSSCRGLVRATIARAFWCRSHIDKNFACANPVVSPTPSFVESMTCAMRRIGLVATKCSVTSWGTTGLKPLKHGTASPTALGG